MNSIILDFLIDWFSWCQDHSEELKEINSNLEFDLHRLNFIKLIEQGPKFQLEALKYSRNFTPYANKCHKGSRFSTWLVEIHINYIYILRDSASHGRSVVRGQRSQRLAIQILSRRKPLARRSRRVSQGRLQADGPSSRMSFKYMVR